MSDSGHYLGGMMRKQLTNIQLDNFLLVGSFFFLVALDWSKYAMCLKGVWEVSGRCLRVV